MPLTQNIIMKLNEITTFVDDKDNLTESEINEIKIIFKELLKTGEHYDEDEIESWFENEGSWTNKETVVRITNLAHYVQTKYEQTDKLRVVSDGSDSCGCGSDTC